jgi:hypothetical protein
MRTRHCCIDTAIVETRCDQQLRRYLMLRDATLYLGRGTEAFTANVVVTGIDCDHFGPLLRAGKVLEADVEIEDGCYRLIDLNRADHARQRAHAHDRALDDDRRRVALAGHQATAAIHRAQRA